MFRKKDKRDKKDLANIYTLELLNTCHKYIQKFTQIDDSITSKLMELYMFLNSKNNDYEFTYNRCISNQSKSFVSSSNVNACSSLASIETIRDKNSLDSIHEKCDENKTDDRTDV
jgi:hypothetical protein